MKRLLLPSIIFATLMLLPARTPLLGQARQGAIDYLNGLGIARGNVAIPASGYLNFGTTQGTTGYGVRDNAGTMEYKSSGGAWASIAGAGGGAPTDAHYLTDRAEAGLSAEVNLGALTTGIPKLTVAAGVATVSVASPGVDYPVQADEEHDAGDSGAAITIDFATNGPLQKVNRTASCTYTLTAPTKPGVVVLRMVHENSATAYTVTFSPVPKYPGGTAPTWTNAANAVDIITLVWNGTTWYGVVQADLK